MNAINRLLIITAISYTCSCKTATQEPYWETTSRIKINSAIWVPIIVEDKEHYALFDFCSFSSFPKKELIDSSLWEMTEKNYRIITEHNSSKVQLSPPILFKIGNKELSHKFILRPDTFPMIGTDVIAKHAWHFNLKDSTLKINNRKLDPKETYKEPFFKAKVRYYKGHPMYFLTLRWNTGHILSEVFRFDTGCSIAQADQNGKTRYIDLAIMVHNIDQFYARKSSFRDIRKARHTHSISDPYRVDVYQIDTLTIEGKPYSDFTIAIVELPFSIKPKEEMALIGMGFYKRFDNLYIEQNNIILYNEK